MALSTNTKKANQAELATPNGAPVLDDGRTLRVRPSRPELGFALASRLRARSALHQPARGNCVIPLAQASLLQLHHLCPSSGRVHRKKNEKKNSTNIPSLTAKSLRANPHLVRSLEKH